MIDLLPTIAGWLKDVGRVELQFPSANDEFPVITIHETYNTSYAVIDHQERLSDFSFQIDVWDNGASRKLCEEIAQQVDFVLLSHGLMRSAGYQIEDPSELHRKTLQYDCRVDVQKNQIYRR